jgi:hypothetical protein
MAEYDGVRGIDLEITDKHGFINGVEVLVADTAIEISPLSRKHILQATITLFVNSLIVRESDG